MNLAPPEYKREALSLDPEYKLDVTAYIYSLALFMTHHSITELMYRVSKHQITPPSMK